MSLDGQTGCALGGRLGRSPYGVTGDFKFSLGEGRRVVGGYFLGTDYGYTAGGRSTALYRERQLGEAARCTVVYMVGRGLGVAIIYTVAASIPKVGAASATTAIITAQVLTACIIDHFGLFGLKAVSFTWSRWVGGALLAAGAWFILR